MKIQPTRRPSSMGSSVLHQERSRWKRLEVSSPGVERPLNRRRDFERFLGERVAVKGTDVLWGRSHRVEGELLGLEGVAGESEAVHR